MIKIRSIFTTLLLCLLPYLLTGCQAVLLNPKGIIAASERNIMITSTCLMLLVVIPVAVLTFTFAWRYRAGNQKAAYEPNLEHNTYLEIIWWSVPCLIIFILGVLTWKSSHELDPYKPLTINRQKTMTIEAISLRWKWLFIYPEQHIATVNFVEFPANVPVRFLITGDGPMNSFQIYQLAGQIYAMAGMESQLNLIANVPGDYKGISANFSGDGFSGMKFIARATSEDEFAAWVKTAQNSPKMLTMSTYTDLARPSINDQVQYFSRANDNIFAETIMKSMMPMNTMLAENHSAAEVVAHSLKNNQ